MGGKSVPPCVGPGMVTRRIVVPAREVVFVKGIVEASEGLAQVFAERGGDLTLASPADREAELEELTRDFERELGAFRVDAPDVAAPPRSSETT